MLDFASGAVWIGIQVENKSWENSEVFFLSNLSPLIVTEWSCDTFRAVEVIYGHAATVTVF